MCTQPINIPRKRSSSNTPHSLILTHFNSPTAPSYINNTPYSNKQYIGFEQLYGAGSSSTGCSPPQHQQTSTYKQLTSGMAPY